MPPHPPCPLPACLPLPSPADALFAGFYRIYLELLHDYQLAEEYCDGLYQERQADQSGMQHLPASLQARLQVVGGPGGGEPAGSGGDLYLLLIQVTRT